MLTYIRSRNNGFAVILIIGVIAILTIVGAVLAYIQRLEHQAAANNINYARARYLAEGGINYAIAELRYGSEGAVNDAVDSSTESLYSSPPSDSGISFGSFSGSYSTFILDCASQVNVNGDTENIINNLGAILAVGCDGDEGTKIATNRPAGGYITKEQLLIALSEAEYKTLRNYLCVYSYTDNKVIDPLDNTSAPYYELAQRSPVNINTAGLPVLRSLLYNISDSSNSISDTEASNLAGYLISGRPYRSWDEVWARLTAAESLFHIGDGDAAVIMANANPNTDYMECNPTSSWRAKHKSDDSASYAIDKTDLSNHTTEFCFNSGGYYEISSVGQISNSSGEIISQEEITVIVKLFDIWRQSSQADFEDGTKNNVQTYPQPDPDSTGIAAADFDGQIMLKTLIDTTPNSGTHFLANYNDEDGDGANNELSADSGQVHQHRQNMPNCNEASVIDATNPGDLYPDGLHPRENEHGLTLGADSVYAAAGAVDRMNGTIEVWVKPDWDASGGDRIGTYDTPRFLEATNSGSYRDSTISLEFWRDTWHKRVVAKIWTEAEPSGGWHGVDNWFEEHPGNGEWYYCIWTDPIDDWEAGQWHHLAFSWHYSDNGTPGDPSDDTGEQKLYVDGQQLDVGQDAEHPVPPKTPFNLINLGDPYGVIECWSTIAGIRIFSAVRTDAEIAADYERGMYYNASDATFTSSLSPDLGEVTLGTISWSEHMPFASGGDIQMDVYDGANWLGSYAGRNDPHGNSLNASTQGNNTIGYRAYFINDTSAGLLDTPVLDDVTITYLGPVEVLYYKE